MCGITGFIDMKNGVTISTVIKMTEVIKHRGPDDEGYQLFNDEGAISAYGNDTHQNACRLLDTSIEKIDGVKYNVAFGHRRLSILDISEAGHQPMCDKKAKIYITYNGEIYNYVEIRKELIEKGHTFRTNTDTEVIIEAYKEWNEDCVRHFNGMWAFALYDKEKRKIFCSRDRLGVKPFHYYLNKEKFVFGSEIKQLIQDNTIPRIMNEEVLAAYLIYRMSDYNEQTLIKNIVQLPGGHNLVILLDFKNSNIKQVNLYRYWCLKIQKYKENNNSLDFEQIIGKELERSIKFRLRSDVKVGALLSGGLDSSSIVTLCQRQLKKEENQVEDFYTFTSSYPGEKEHDETYYAHLINEFCGCKEHLITPKCENVEKELEHLVWHMEGFSGYAVLGTLQVIRIAAELGIHVILNGQGGDETLFGYERYYAFYLNELLKTLKVSKFFRELYKITRCSKLSFGMLVKMFFYFNIPYIRNKRNHLKVKRYIKNSLIRKLNYTSIKNYLYPQNLSELQYNELLHGQLTHILRMDDRGYMAYSVESRVPFIDYKFIEAVVSISPEEKIKDGYTKILLRNYMDDKMPKEVTWRKNKMGFSAPVDRFANQISDLYIKELLEDARSKSYFNIDFLKMNYIKMKSSQMMSDFLTVELFMRLFDIKEQ